jgi:hypothetical protein
MFRSDLADRDDPALVAIRERLFGELQAVVELAAREGAFPAQFAHAATLGSWSIAHGYADLWSMGPLQARMPGVEPLVLAGSLFDFFLATMRLSAT